jgi:hypothetical protein
MNIHFLEPARNELDDARMNRFIDAFSSAAV